MEKLYETASNIQCQLPQQYKHPEHFVEVSWTAVKTNLLKELIQILIQWSIIKIVFQKFSSKL